MATGERWGRGCSHPGVSSGPVTGQGAGLLSTGVVKTGMQKTGARLPEELPSTLPPPACRTSKQGDKHLPGWVHVVQGMLRHFCRRVWDSNLIIYLVILLSEPIGG